MAMTFGRSAWLCLTLAALALPAPALADDAKKAEARALFDEGRELMSQGKHASACPKLEAAQELSPGMGILYNLAECYEAVGKTASAWSAFGRVASQADEAGYEQRAEDARRRRDALEPRLTRLRVVVSIPVKGLVIKRGANVLPAGSWGTALPIDAGRHTIRAEAPGHEAWSTTVDATTPAAIVEVAVPRLAATTDTREPAAATSPPRRPDVARASDSAEPTKANTWQAPLGIAGFTLGGATALVGVGVAIAAKLTADGADCDPDNRCSDEGLADRDTAVTLGHAATGLLIAGGVLGAAGLVVWLTAPTDAGGVAVRVSPTAASLRFSW